MNVEELIIKKLDELKDSKNFYDIDFCQMLLFVIHQNMTKFESSNEQINRRILELLENIDILMRNRQENYLSEGLTKFLNINRK